MTPEEKIESLNFVMPNTKPKAFGSYIPYVRADNLVFISGQIPISLESTTNELQFKGKVGTQISIEDAQNACKVCCINALSILKNLIGDLEKVKRIVKITGYVNCDESFTDHPKVLNGASDFLNEIFGEIGRHTRVAVGVNSLPLNSPVEIDFIIEI
ncbi:MAG TPA: RidA family protein [Candidatus Nitrosocosmicus sp.]|nr:RidA family protein [Candidatus Nitrosocosmicus sp.]